MEMKQVYITPRVATKILEKNGANRPISKRTVDCYARDMKNGKWTNNTGSAISISKDGTLLDGQHRLMAIQQSGVHIMMWVCFGCDSDGIYDNNRKRTVRDQLNMTRTDLPCVMRNNQFIGMIRYLVAGSGGKATAGDIEDYIDKHRRDLDGFVSLGVMGKTKGKITICVVYVALYQAYVNGVSGEAIKRFMEILRSGMASCPEEYPIIAYRNYLLEGYKTLSVIDEGIAVCQGALKKYITGSCLKRIYKPKDVIWKMPKDT